MQSDMEILTDMLSGDESPFGEIIEKGQDISYYSSFGIYLIKQFENKEQYYQFLLSAVSNFKTLDDKQKKMIQNKMEIFPETIVKEKIIYREKKGPKNSSKPKLNRFDDY